MRSNPSRRIPLLLAILVGGLGAYLILRPKSDSLTALDRLAHTLIEGRPLQDVILYLGSERMANDKADAVIRELGAKHFEGGSIVKKEIERRGDAHAAMQLTLRDSTGNRRYLALTCVDTRDGGAIRLRRLLECIWDSDAIFELGRFPSNEAIRAGYYAKGLSSDQDILKRHGVLGLDGTADGDGFARALESYQQRAEKR